MLMCFDEEKRETLKA